MMATSTTAGGRAASEGDSPGQDATPAPEAWWERRIPDGGLLLIVAAVTLPFVWMGYGTDIDVRNVLETAELIRNGSYMPSRTPGAPVFETIVAVLDPVGGHILVNLATAAAAGALVVGTARLVRAWGHDNGDLTALALVASPVMIVASSSLTDFVWALAFLVWGGLVHLGTVPLPGRLSHLPTFAPAGVLFGLAVGVRATTGLLVVAFLVADGWDREHRGRSVRAGIIGGLVGSALFIPSWLAFDRSAEFLKNDEVALRSLTQNFGLFFYKNYIFAGGLALVVLAFAAPALLRSLRNWSGDPLLRFAGLALIVGQGLYFRFPLKLGHLLPALLATLLWVAASEIGRHRRYLWVLIAALAVNGLVTFRPLAPDTPGQASTGSWNPAVTAGPLLNDIDCRTTSMRFEPTQQVVNEAWACYLRPVRGDMVEDSDSD